MEVKIAHHSFTTDWLNVVSFVWSVMNDFQTRTRWSTFATGGDRSIRATTMVADRPSVPCRYFISRGKPKEYHWHNKFNPNNRQQKRPSVHFVEAIRRFVGMCQYYRRFVPNFSKIIKPLTNLTRKGVQFEWTNDHQQAFSTMLHTLSNEPMLAIFNPDRPFILYMDASNIAVGATLAQVAADGLEHPVG